MRSLSAKIVVAVIGACLVYLAWRWSAAPGRGESDAPVDTMCLASRIGLPCNDP